MLFRCHVPILRSIQHVVHKYGDFKKASRIYPHELFIPIKSIIETEVIIVYLNTPHLNIIPYSNPNSDPKSQ